MPDVAGCAGRADSPVIGYYRSRASTLRVLDPAPGLQGRDGPYAFSNWLRQRI